MLSYILRIMYLLLIVTLSASGKLIAQPDTEKSLPVGLDGEKAPYPQLLQKLRGLADQTVADTDQPSTLTLAQLREGQIKWRSSISSMELTFEYQKQLPTVSAPPNTGNAKSETDLPDDFSFRLSFAFQGDKGYAHYQETTASRLKELRNPGLQADMKVAFNGKLTRTYSANQTTGQILPGRDDGILMNAMMYLGTIQISVVPSTDILKSTERYIPQALSYDDLYRVQNRLESVDGFPCHVVTSGVDTFWLDPAAGYACRRRVTFRRTNPSESGCLAHLEVCRDLRKVSPEVWLPFECHRLDFAAPPRSVNNLGKLLETHIMKVKSATINAVTDDRFELVFPPSTDVHDLIEKKAYFMPRSAEDLDAAIASARKIAEDGFIQPAPVPTRSSTFILVISTIVLIAIGAIVWWFRSRHRQNPKVA
jgi:hypothetical protein